jgi:hypothetical protein
MLIALLIFQNSIKSPMPALIIIIQLVSLSSKYRKIMIWQTVLSSIVRMDMPSKLFLFFQKDISLYNVFKVMNSIKMILTILEGQKIENSV